MRRRPTSGVEMPQLTIWGGSSKAVPRAVSNAAESTYRWPSARFLSKYSSPPHLPTPICKGCDPELDIMPRTRKQEAAEKQAAPDHPEQTEVAPENPSAAEEPTTEKKDDDGDAAPNAARERLQRFKALQARAVSLSYSLSARAIVKNARCFTHCFTLRGN